ncbi:MAG: CPBP family intramembrane glutamic endopeptidase [Gemmatimonadaceae bacterium]
MTQATVRSRRETLLAAAATAGVMGVAHYFPDRDDGSGSILAGLSAFVAVALGLAAVATARPLERRSASDHARIAIFSIGLGIALGLANLSANYGMAMLDPAVHQGMVERWANFSPWSMVVTGPMTEEIIFRLLLMGGVGWLASRFTKNPRTIFLVALGVSASAFGLVHIFYGGIEGLLYSIVVAVKAGAAGLVLGWIFWRWGLPYSFACHGTANAVHMLLIPAVF